MLTLRVEIVGYSLSLRPQDQKVPPFHVGFNFSRSPKGSTSADVDAFHLMWIRYPSCGSNAEGVMLTLPVGIVDFIFTLRNVGCGLIHEPCGSEIHIRGYLLDSGGPNL